jgi:hypothetical protein
MSQQQVAILISLANWNTDQREVLLEDGLRLSPLVDPALIGLYHRMCSQFGADYGALVDYDLCVTLSNGNDRRLCDLEDSWSIANQLCNLIVVVTRGIAHRIRFIRTNDGFRTVDHTGLLMEWGEDTGCIEGAVIAITTRRAEEIVSAWRCLRAVEKAAGPHNRLHCSLNYYRLAWRSGLLTDMALNLETSLRILLGSTGSAHELAADYSRLLSELGCAGEDSPRFVHAIADVRQRVIQNGEMADPLGDSMRTMLHSLATAFRCLLLDPNRAFAICDRRAA